MSTAMSNLRSARQETTTILEANQVIARGNPITRQGVDGAYDQCWYPLMLERDMPDSGIAARPFLNGRVVVYRGKLSGEITVLSPFCRHLGASLEVGEVIGDDIRCAFHHWSYDQKGACVHIAAGDPPPSAAKLIKFPSAVKYGIVWAFNGPEPLFDVPGFTVSEDDIVYEADFAKEMDNLDPYMSYSNSMDLQHLRTVHNIVISKEPEDIEVTPHMLEYDISMIVPGGIGATTQHTSIFGTNTIVLEHFVMGRPTFQMSAACTLPNGRIALYEVNGTAKPSGKPGEEQLVKNMLPMLKEFGRKLQEEDREVHETMSFRPDVMTRSDRALAIYMEFARNFPRSNWASDMIGR